MWIDFSHQYGSDGQLKQINDVIWGSSVSGREDPNQVNLTQFRTWRDYKHGGANPDRAIRKSVRLQKFLSKRDVENPGWLATNQSTCDAYSLFRVDTSGYGIGTRIGTVHARFYISFREPAD